MDVQKTNIKKVNEYLVHYAKYSRAKGFDFFQLWGPKDASMNLGTFLSGTQWLKALPKNKDNSQMTVFSV